MKRANGCPINFNPKEIMKSTKIFMSKGFIQCWIKTIDIKLWFYCNKYIIDIYEYINDRVHRSFNEKIRITYCGSETKTSQSCADFFILVTRCLFESVDDFVKLTHLSEIR